MYSVRIALFAVLTLIGFSAQADCQERGSPMADPVTGYVRSTTQTFCTDHTGTYRAVGPKSWTSPRQYPVRQAQETVYYVQQPQQVYVVTKPQVRIGSRGVQAVIEVEGVMVDLDLRRHHRH